LKRVEIRAPKTYITNAKATYVFPDFAN
jgi:hypothetical protein